MTYPSIRIEGAILSPDIFERIEDLPGQKPTDFGFDSSVKVKDEIARAWADAQDYWRIFQRKLETLKPSSPATTETRQQWVAPLLGLLGYQLEYQARGTELNGKTYTISHRATNRANAPVHILGYREPAGLDRKPELSNVRMSAHALVQEFINLSEQLYALVTNGRILRLLRDTSRLIKLSYLEFDLDRIFTDGLFADFAILYRLLHATRMPLTNDTASESLIERFHQDTIEQGTRIREGLRAAVTQALEILGTGFIAHPENRVLREQIEVGTLDHTTFFNHLLRLIYRLLFLNVVEERGLIFPKGTRPSQLRIYFDYYSVRRLRRLARTRGLKTDRHHDAWLSLLSTFQLFERSDQAAILGTTAFNGQLFDPHSLGPLNSCRLSNAALLYALDRLCSFDDPRTNQRLPVNFGALATEEFGSVYESLLELHPVVETTSSPRFSFKQAGGNERKTSGSYYTHASLVDCLLDSALDPIIDDRVRNHKVLGYSSAEDAILSLKVCDPACGSGHFLIAATQRIARRLALSRVSDEEPSPDALRHALRQVISRCIYAVDINPMSVELCRVALWLEGVEPGKPLSFLDHHIRVGNSLVGATPELIAAGIPDDAFTVIEGDDKKACAALKRRNQAEKEGLGPLFAAHDAETQALLEKAAAALEELPDDRPEEIRAKELAFLRHEQTEAYRRKKHLADAWCAAFFIRKQFSEAGRESSANGITQAHLNDLASERQLPPDILSEIEDLSEKQRFFHWHLAYPEVFSKGGFDCVLGNPPWDKLTPDSKEFFSQYDADVRFADSASERAIIDALVTDPAIERSWMSHRRERFCEIAFIKNSLVYKLFAPGNLGKGDFNSYRFFLELALNQVAPGGAAAQLVPEGLYNGANAAAIRKTLFEEFTLQSLYGFENAHEVWFEGIDSRAKFCIYTARKAGRTSTFRTAFNIRSLEDLRLAKSSAFLEIPVSLVVEFSPDALSLLEFRSQHDIAISQGMYELHPKLGDLSAGPPLHSQSREIDMTNDAELFCEDPTGFPLYEGRMIDQYDHRAKGYVSGRARAAAWKELDFDAPDKTICPQWRIMPDRVPEKDLDRVSRYRIGYGWVASPTNKRSLISALLPPASIAGNAVPTIMYAPEHEWMYILWLATANSFTMDFLVRMKVSLNLTFTLLNSLPFPRPQEPNPLVHLLSPYVLELSCTSIEMNGFWQSMATLGLVSEVPDVAKPAGTNDPERRFAIRALVDAIVAHKVFGISRDSLDYIMNTFPIVEEDDRKKFGRFLTKIFILRAFDCLEQQLPPDQVLLQLLSLRGY